MTYKFLLLGFLGAIQYSQPHSKNLVASGS